MSARCSSCHYALSVCDSVACRECFSYFHIDCAQLVGFPLFELSDDPSRNTFHCTTCQLLPLPVPRDDSDSSDEEGMPSRQLEYSLEGDCGKDMNEVKGTIQDLSDLCKDMLREINDLKSINLTLRCCIENLRHDNEQRDTVISELKRRLDLLEGRNIEGKGNKSVTNYTTEKESIEIKTEESVIQTSSYDQTTFQSATDEESKEQSIFSSYTTSSNQETEGFELEETSTGIENYKLSSQDKWDSMVKPNVDSEIGYSEKECYNEDKSDAEKENILAEEVVRAEVISETNESRQDWSWKGSDAVEVKKVEDESEEEDEEYESGDEADFETPSWKKLKEEIETAMEEDQIVDTAIEPENKEPEEKEEQLKTRKSVRWDEEIEDESETETEYSQREVDSKRDELSEAETETIPDGEVRDDESSIAEVEERLEAVREDFLLESGVPTIEEEGHLETNESVEEEQKSIESSAVHPLEGDRLDDEEVEAQVQGDETLEGELRFEGEEKVDEEAKLEEEVTLDGDVRLEEQITLDGESRLEGEVTMDEGTRLEDPEFHDEEEVLPPETPPPEHTEEDLWSYLRENVSSVHPSTVDEFVQNLIGTLQHVPKEYLQPVIEANIKRATSPSVTDGEHPSSPEGYRQDEVSEEVNQSRNQEDYSDPSQTQGTLEEDFPAPTQEVSSEISATD